MKKLIFLTLTIFYITGSLFSQCTAIKSLRKLAQKGNYAKLAQKSKILAQKNKKNAFPYYMICQSGLSEFTYTHKIKYLNQSLNYALRATHRDKKGQCTETFKNTLSSLKHLSLKRADSLFSTANKDDAVFYYAYIAKIYGDTTKNYQSILKPEKQQNVALKTQAERDLSKFSLKELQNLNKIDSKGKRNGLWIKFYKNGLPAYIITFKDGKPIGDYYRYHENGVRKAHLIFDKKGFAKAELFDRDTSLLAKGYYSGTNKDSVWNYFFPNGNIAAEYTFLNDKKNGRSKIFYPNKQVFEVLDWKANLKEGLWRQFYPNGKVKMEALYKNNKKEGAFNLYFKNGNIDTKGHYKNGLRDGLWQYYNRSNHLIKKEEYSSGKLPIELKIDSLETELKIQQQIFNLKRKQKKSVEDLQQLNTNILNIKNKLSKLETQSPDEKETKDLKFLDKKLPASEDPMNYLNNPQDFFKKQNK